MPRRPNIVQQSVFENNNSCNMAVETEKTTSVREDTMLMDTSMNECDSPSKEEGMDWTPKVNKSSGGGGGGGRRKQSKPSRVFMDIDSEQNTGQAPAAPVPDGKENIGETLPANIDLRMDIDEPYKDDLCGSSGEAYHTQNALIDHQHHIASVHDIRPVIEEDRQSFNFPTKYHRLGSELQEGMNLTKGAEMGGGGGGEEVPEPRQLPPPQEQGGHPEPHHSASGELAKSSRIFHQDAYCELCDREFCNKYFLKTHKANKHGIYDNSPTPTTSNNSNSSSGSTGMPSLSSSGMGPGPTFAALPRLDELPPMSLPVSLPPAIKLPMKEPSPILSMPPTTSPASLSSLPPMPMVSTPSKPPSNNGSSSSGTPSKPAPDMEDYCEICQKHFCNKYYLKKHKHDVHGIVPENASQSSGTKRGRPSTLGSSLSGSTCITTSSSSICPPLLLPHNTPITSANMLNGAGGMPGLNSMGNFMFINPFAQPVLIQAQPSLQPNLQPLPAGLVPQQLAGLPQVPPPPTTPDSGKSSVPSTSPSSVQLPTDPLRALSGQGQEVTCELCRKEFCNKYFLKLHKAHKHGIYYDDLTGMGPVLLPPGLGGPPEGMSLGGPEPGETTSEPPREKSAQSAKSSPEKKEPLLGEEVCEICHKEFSNRYSLRVHLINAHNVKPHDFDVSSISSSITQEIMKAEKLNGAQNLGGTMFGNMIAAKLADRVMCDICNKEVCNKYFLKTHKIKVHGVDPSQLDKEREQQEKQSQEKAAAMSNNCNPLNLSASANSLPKVEVKPETVVRPNDDELLKMGIDPEAYCEICKKEFCSKYFLKTHKLNIHGIKTEYRPSMPPTPEKVKPMTTMAPVLTPPSLSHNPRHSPVHGPILQIPAPPQLHNENSNSSESSSGKWRWKEPVNATRVSCELCGKEVCNKYFLKTHLLNKHGIYYDIASGQTSAPTKIPGIPGRLSSGSIKAEVKNVNESSVASTGSASDAASLPGMVVDGENKDADNVVSAKTWQVPPEGLKKEQLPEDLLKTNDGEFYIQKCDICGMIFGEKVTLQLHMIRDHQGQVTVKAEDAAGHEYRPSLATTLGMSLKRKYQRSAKKASKRSKLRRFGSNPVAGIGEKVKSAIVNHIQSHQQMKKKYRCAHCQERFCTRALCQTHIRSAHGHVKSAEPESAAAAKPLRSRQLAQTNGNHSPSDDAAMDTKESPQTPKQQQQQLPPSHAMPSKLSDDSQVIMQSFTLEERGEGEEGEDRFATSVVYLPVFRKISDPISTTFTLTPTMP